MGRPKKSIGDIIDEQYDFQIPDIEIVTLSNKREIDLYRDEHRNLDNLNIEFDIDGYTFKGFTLKNSILSNATFKNIKAQGIDFTSTILQNCIFEKCDFRWASFTLDQTNKNIFKDCNLREINVLS